jgi:hypothetical protein
MADLAIADFAIVERAMAKKRTIQLNWKELNLKTEKFFYEQGLNHKRFFEYIQERHIESNSNSFYICGNEICSKFKLNRRLFKEILFEWCDFGFYNVELRKVKGLLFYHIELFNKND